MKPRTCFVAVYVALGLAATLHAQADCADWNTGAFFEVAEVSNVTRCLQAGMDPQARDESGLTPLHTAVAFGNTEAIAALVRAGADPEARSRKMAGTMRKVTRWPVSRRYAGCEGPDDPI